MLVAIFEFEGHAAILNVPIGHDVCHCAAEHIPIGLDYWIVEEVEVPAQSDDPSDPITEPQMIDYGVTVGITKKSGVGTGPAI